MLLDHADFALQEQTENNLTVAFSRAWYNGSYTMAAKPIKSLELHYTMIQFLIKKVNTRVIWCRSHKIMFFTFSRRIRCTRALVQLSIIIRRQNKKTYELDKEKNLPKHPLALNGA